MPVALITAILCVAADLITKQIALSALAPDKSVVVMDGVLNFTYVENRGMAFGLFSQHRYIFLFLSFVLLIAVAVFLFFYRKRANLWIKLACGLILGGGVGNMIDRIGRGYVVDFFDVRLFDFWKWVFNVADACVCVGVFMLAIYLIADSIRCERENKRQQTADPEEDDG